MYVKQQVRGSQGLANASIHKRSISLPRIRKLLLQVYQRILESSSLLYKENKAKQQNLYLEEQDKRSI